jgi:phospholipid/cholesterol/gamma-HCH transport system substrate-binding protein
VPLFCLLLYSTTATKAGTVSGYEIIANFNEIGGLKKGNDVRIGGVKIGSVKSIDLNSATYQAKVTFSIENSVKIPTDTAARVSSESLMGGAYVALDIGGDEENIRPKGSIKYTQDAQNLEQLLGKFIFSQASKDKTEPGAAPATPAINTDSMPKM